MPAALEVARQLTALGFTYQATTGTAAYLRDHGVPCETVNKVKEGRPHIVDHIKNGRGGLGREHRAHRGVTCRFIVDPPGGLE